MLAASAGASAGLASALVGAGIVLLAVLRVTFEAVFLDGSVWAIKATLKVKAVASNTSFFMIIFSSLQLCVFL